MSRLKIYGSNYCPEFITVARSWKERLFTLPWRPFKRYRQSDYRVAYLLDGVDGQIVVCHPTVAAEIQDALTKMNGELK